MDVEQLGSFRTRTRDDGSLEVWARGWRLESQLYALIPTGLALMFLLAPMPLPMRGAGAIVMLVAALFVFRMTQPGLLFDEKAVTIVSVVRKRAFDWGRVSGFMGERRHDEGRVLLVLEGDEQVALPGTLDPSELDPYGDEGETLSAVDQLNRLFERSRAGDLPRPKAPVVPLRARDSDEPTRKDRRAERKELRAALKAVRLGPDSRVQPEPEPESVPESVPEPEAPRRSLLHRRSRPEPAAELTAVEISEPVTEEPAPRRRSEPEPSSLPSYFPKPVYIPQAEYAQMLRDQRAAEKAAAAAAEELSELAELDELATKDEFSDWTS